MYSLVSVSLSAVSREKIEKKFQNQLLQVLSLLYLEDTTYLQHYPSYHSPLPTNKIILLVKHNQPSTTTNTGSRGTAEPFVLSRLRDSQAHGFQSWSPSDGMILEWFVKAYDKSNCRKGVKLVFIHVEFMY